MERILQLLAEPRHQGRTLKQIMQREFGMSSSLVSKMKNRKNSILVNGQAQWTNFVVQEGQALTFVVESPESLSENIVPTLGPLDIIFEDEDVLVINKPAHIPCHPVIGNQENTLANFLAAFYAAQGQSFTARIINRLDNNTTGLVLFGKNALSASILNTMSRNGEIHKKYTAITLGIPSAPSGEIRQNLRRLAGSSIKHEICNENDGRKATTIYELLSVSRPRNLALLSIKTLSGRTHQIRVHMASIACPLAGDFLYGTEDLDLIPRHALHMGNLCFMHPISRASLHFTAPLPPDMQSILFDFTEI